MFYINTNYMLVHDLNTHLEHVYVSYFVVCFTGISQDLDLADAFEDDVRRKYDIYDDLTM